MPPLSDRPTEMKMLSDKEVDIVFKWLGVRLTGCSSLINLLAYSLPSCSSSSTSSTGRETAYPSRTCATPNTEVSDRDQ